MAKLPLFLTFLQAGIFYVIFYGGTTQGEGIKKDRHGKPERLISFLQRKLFSEDAGNY